MQLQRKLAGIPLAQPLMNAAGTCKTLEQVFNIARSISSAVVLGSVTMEQRTGNPGTVYCSVPGQYALNSLGMPNAGLEYYLELLPELSRICHENEKPLIVSVAGMHPTEYSVLASALARRGADLIELNLGCPNVWQDLDGGESLLDGGPQQKGIPAFEPEVVEVILRSIDMDPVVPRYIVKLSPIGDPKLLKTVGTLIANSKACGVTASNTFPNGYRANEKWQPVLGPIYGGISGPAMKPIVLGQVKQLRECLRPDQDIIGAGGVRTTKDVVELLDAGATAVQAATAYFESGENPGVFGDIMSDIMEFEKAPAFA